MRFRRYQFFHSPVGLLCRFAFIALRRLGRFIAVLNRVVIQAVIIIIVAETRVVCGGDAFNRNELGAKSLPENWEVFASTIDMWR